MNGETHTSGPWAYDGVRVFSPAHDTKVLVRREDGTEVEHGCGLIALVYAPPGSSRLANADLITAAPLMLDTLKAVWMLAEAADLGNPVRAQFRNLVASVIDAAEGRLGNVIEAMTGRHGG